MTFYLDERLKPYFRADKPLFEQLMSLSGEVYRALEGRKTQRVKLGERYYFIKQHRGVGISDIIKNLLQGKMPVISAKNEWQAIQRLLAHGIDAPRVLAYGERGWNPARKQSFVLLEAVESRSLEQVTASWREAPPPFQYKLKLLRAVARIARVMHAAGMNHRDFYLCHFLQRDSDAQLCLLDLHRAQIRQKTPQRWQIKDLAGLYFSSKDIGLTVRDQYRFMIAYCQQSLRAILKKEKPFWQQVQQRGEKLYRDHHRK